MINQIQLIRIKKLDYIQTMTIVNIHPIRQIVKVCLHILSHLQQKKV